MTSRREFLKVGLAASALPDRRASGLRGAGSSVGDGAALQGALRHAVPGQRRVRAARRGTRPRGARDGGRHDAVLVRRSLPSLAARARRDRGPHGAGRAVLPGAARVGPTHARRLPRRARRRGRRLRRASFRRSGASCCRRPSLRRRTTAWAARWPTSSPNARAAAAARIGSAVVDASAGTLPP